MLLRYRAGNESYIDVKTIVPATSGSAIHSHDDVLDKSPQKSSESNKRFYNNIVLANDDKGFNFNADNILTPYAPTGKDEIGHSDESLLGNLTYLHNLSSININGYLMNSLLCRR